MDTLITHDGSLTIKHADHGEAYHSLLGARTEAEQLYIRRSSFLERVLFQPEVCVLDVGLGLGYNAMTTIDAWMHCDPQANTLRMVSLECDEHILKNFLSTHANWQANWPPQWLKVVSNIQQHKDGHYFLELPQFSWHIFAGDAREFDFSDLNIFFDYVWHDPFSPTKNPNMWTKEWFEKIKIFCKPNCELMTYSVARQVKDNLAAAGWQFNRISGLGSKKHWLKSTLPI